MATVTARPMPADEFFDWVHQPAHRDCFFELEAGAIVERVLGGFRHGVVCANVAGVLGQYVRQQKKGYVCGNNTGIILERDPDTVRGPDVALYLESQRYDELAVKYAERVPALVVEVLSPTDRVNRMVKRIDQFLARGVAMAWLIDPETRSLAVWRPQQAQLVLEAEEEVTGLELLPDFRCRVADFFDVPGSAPAPG